MTTTFCPDEDVLQMWIEGTLDADEYTAVAEHAATCGACRSLIAVYKQLMWDLQQPEPVPVADGQDRVYDALMAEWRRRQEEEKAAAVRTGWPRRLLPAWAGYSVMWTSHLPPVRLIRNALLRRRPEEGPEPLEASESLARRAFKRLLRRKGGG